jgi:hypothetical protein
MNGKDLFAKLDGTPAQILIILGLALTLFAPIWPRFSNATVSKTKAQLDQAGQMIELDMEKFKKDQNAERKKMNENPVFPYEERIKKEEEMQRAADAKRADLEKTFDSTQLKRAYLEAQTDAAGARSYLIIGWLGRLLLLLGLLTMTIKSEGLKQKIILIILLVAMFSSLAGINFDFVTLGHMGDNPTELERILRSR